MSQVATPITLADTDTRNAYLLRVALMAAAGISVSAVVGTLSALTIAAFPNLFMGRMMQLVVIFGSIAVANYAARPLAFSQSTAVALGGFGLGAVFQGIAMGYILLMGWLMGMGAMGNGLFFIGQAFGMVVLAVVGMVLYLSTGPREFSMLRAGLAMLMLPMFALMALSFAFPGFFTGGLGLGLCVVFVLVSAAGLLVQVNDVMHRYRTDMVIAGSYSIMMGVLILFWNLLSLLMHLGDR